MRSNSHALRIIAAISMIATGLVATTHGVASAAGHRATLPTDNPANFTPNVLDGEITSIWQIGDRVVVGGTFTQIANSTSNGGTVYDRTNIAAFDATTGLVDTGFDPVLNNSVEAVVPAGDGTSVFVGGAFNTVNGTNRRKIARIDLASGELVESFDVNGVNAIVRDVRVVGDEVIIGGLFTSVGSTQRSYLASLDAETGAVTDHIDIPIAGQHNGGVTKVIKLEVTPDGSRLLMIGNFTSVAGQARDQIALIDLSSDPAVLSPWHTDFFTSTCASAFDTFVRDLDISEDGTFAAVTTTGAYRANTSCDTVSRLEIDVEQPNLSPTWISYTGGDTSYAAEIHDGVVFIGGHMRWFNNPFAADRHGAGGIAREGMAALDAVTGLPFSWDPGRERGVGLFDYHITDQGIWAGSDTNRWNDELRMKLAFFPWSGGTQVQHSDIGDLPNNIFQLGRSTGTTGTTDPSVMYRVNAGGSALTSVDDGPDWIADTASTSPYRNSGSSRSTAPSGLATPNNDSAVPESDFDRPPAHLWTTERWDPASGSEMEWTFPVDAGTPVQVRLYLSNRCRCTNEAGERVFDIDLDGVNIIDDLDLTMQVGHDVGTTRSFDIVSDGVVNILFRHEVENPVINGIEIIRLDVPAGGTVGTQDDVTQFVYDGVNPPSGGVVTSGTAMWRNVRSAFMADSTLYTLHTDGSILRRTLDGGTFGAGVPIDMWSNDVMADMTSMTGIFYDPATDAIYYTLAGQNNLYVRDFLPESHSIGATRGTATGAVAALAPSRVSGMFLGNGQLWFGDAATGNLLSMPYSGGVVSGTPSVADTTIDWRSNALFRSSTAQPNVPPIASFSASCTDNVCDFDGSASIDPDGTILSYDWNFGDGNTGTGMNAQHAYTAGGSYTVTLTVTDDRSGTGQFAEGVSVTDPPNVAPTASFTAACDLLECSFDGSNSSDPDGTIDSYAWDFGDGNTGTGVAPVHTYADPGSYPVTLTVTDNDNASGSTTNNVEAFAPGGAAAFRAASSAYSNSADASITVPGEVQPGDQLILIVSASRLTTISTPAGWTLLDSEDDPTNMRSWVFTRTADATTAGSSVASTLGESSKSARLLVAYQNAAPPTTALSSVRGGTSAELTTATANVTTAGSAVVSYWADRTSGNTGWSLPPSVISRATAIGAGGGRITAAIADANVAPGVWPGATATSTASSSKAIGWTIVLAASTENQPPVAAFSATCAALECSFDAATSYDPDGTIDSYAWDFGDGNTGTGVAPVHTYADPGSYPVTLTVTDNDNASGSTTNNVEAFTGVVGFRASASSNANTTSATVSVPAEVVSGDQLLLFVSANSAVTATTPAGWTLLGTAEDGAPDVRSFVYTSTADATSAGTTITVALGARTKNSAVLLAYSNAAPIATVASAVKTSTSTDLTTPSIVVGTDGSLVVSYWVDKTSGNAGWTLPGNVTPRESSVGSGGGRITAAAGDSGTAAGTWPGASATGTVSGSKAIAWSVVIPAP